MYSQHYPLVNNIVYSQQPQQPYQQQQRLPPPLHPAVIQQTRKEPLPSATDAKPNITLSIPEIAEFSSTMVYLMWHARRQSVMDLHSNSKSTNIQQHQNNSLEQTRVTVDLANMTSTAFKKFCRQILSATQLSESVVLLSLKYIAMLLQNNPNIQGADGSEYRLFTVALMLANKFLDDNTFTNKTWSEVSGMKVVDLNIMELEFLDVLKFRLSIQKEEYERWRTALFGFRNQLINVPIEIQRQKLMETMELSVNSQWMQKQQQHAAAESKHDFFLFSKAQQQYPVQPTFHGPLTRVPLRIPSQPVYHNLHTTPSAPMNVYNEQKTYAYLPPSTKQQSRNNYTQQQSPFHTPSSSNTTRAFPYSNVDHYPKQTSHRTTSLPSNGGGGGIDLAASKNNSSYYYATPSTTPTYTTPVNYPTTTSYYVDPSSNTTTTSTSATPYNSSSSPTDYNPYHNSSIAPVNDVYNRSMGPRSTSYKNVQPSVVTPTGYQQQQSYHHQPQQAHQGPTLEDPLTAIDSYRTKLH